jgi:hypothetical protein
MIGPSQLNLKRYYLPSKRTGIGRKNADSGTVQVIDKATAKEAFASSFPGFSESNSTTVRRILRPDSSRRRPAPLGLPRCRIGDRETPRRKPCHSAT